MTAEQGTTHDVIVAGGGMAGVLAAARIHAANPELSILLLEKEPQLGGRVRSRSDDGRTYGYGLNGISQDLYHFLERTLCENEDAPDLEELVGGKLETFGVLQSNKMRMLPINEWYSKKGAKALGGLAAARNWESLEELLMTTESSDKTFQQIWKNNRKAPVAVVMEHFCAAYGIADLWGSTSKVITERAGIYASPMRSGCWKPVFEALIGDNEKIQIENDCRIISGTLEENTWVLDTAKDSFRGQKLVVAQPPWQATLWLDRSLWPSALGAFGSKTKPTSVVVLTEQLSDTFENKDELPDVTLIPSERVQAINTRQGEVCFQATIDFEMSLDAPAVLKAVRRVKRARKKLLHLYPDVVSSRDHIALQPFAWAQPTAARDLKTVEKMGKKGLHTATLCFCGDAYGESYNGDNNLMTSVVATCEALAE